MRIAVGADHAGYSMRPIVIEAIEKAGHTIVDFGAFDATPVDYPDYALFVGRAIQNGDAERGVLLCGSGIGVSIAANKLNRIRAGVCHDIYSSHQAVEHDNMNVLCLGPRVVGPALAIELVNSFLAAQFSGEERHRRRLDKITLMEETG
jgi:ribose 5-phosphate isomerase B